MRIAYLTTSFVPSRAANSVQVVKMAHALGRRGHDVTLYAAYGDTGIDPMAFYGVGATFELARTVRPAGGRLGAARYLASQVARLHTAPRADLYYGRAARLLLAAAPLGRPLGYEAHVLPSSAGRRAAQKALFALPNFAGLVCISDALRRDYLAAFPRLDPQRVLVAHDGSDPLDLPDNAPRTLGRPGALQVGYVGSIYRGRGIDTLVHLATALPDVDFQVIGGAPDAVDDARQDAPSNMHFHGHQPHAELPAFYAQLDVLTAPYRGDRVAVHGGGGDIRRWMSPLKVFEYMSTGRAIVSADIPVLREVLRDGENAMLVPSDDLAAWVDAIAALRDDPRRRAQLGAAALSDFLAHYTWEQRADAIAALASPASATP